MTEALDPPLVFRIQRGVGVTLVSAALVPVFWEKVSPWIEKALKASYDEVSIDRCYSALQSGEWELVLATRGKDLIGVACIEKIHTQHGYWLNVPFLTSDSLESINRIFDFAESRVMDSDDCLGIKWYSGHPKCDSFADRRGYKKRFVEYVKAAEGE